MKLSDQELGERMVALVALAGNTGALSWNMRYDKHDDRVAWICQVTYKNGWDCAAGITPLHAAMRMLDQLVDGGRCTYCNRPTAIIHDLGRALPPMICTYQYDPELKTYRRSCEGETPTKES